MLDRIAILIVGGLGRIATPLAESLDRIFPSMTVSYIFLLSTFFLLLLFFIFFFINYGRRGVQWHQLQHLLTLVNLMMNFLYYH